MTISELKTLLSKFHIKPDKHLGQNFLLSEKVIEEIVAAAELSNTDQALEIGPGLGILTRALAGQAGEVTAIEKDRKLAIALKKIFKNKKNVKIVNDDALFFDPSFYDPTAKNYKLIANIPYYITGKLLQNFLTAEHKPSLMVLLLQKEVAQRITAGPGDMSILSVSVQFYADPEIVSIVPADNFFPKPEVDSAVVRLRVLDRPRFPVDEKKFFQLVKIGFSNKRKMLKNNLSAMNVELPADMLVQLGVNPLTRAQDLSLSDWYKLYQKMFDT